MGVQLYRHFCESVNDVRQGSDRFAHDLDLAEAFDNLFPDNAQL
jgi:hypothetical protein